MPEYFVESWTYSSALSVIDSCEAWAANFELEKADLQTYNSVKGELFELARTQVCDFCVL